jgi:RNA recognition motif-containing protein
LQGLPFKASDEDIEEFFSGFNMVAGSVKYQKNEEDRKTGHAAVLFESQEDADRAFKEKQK